MEKKKAIIIGGSAGSINVIMQILPAIASQLCPPIIIVIHRKSFEENILEEMLQSKSKITVKEVNDKMKVESNTIYLAPANYHLLVEKAMMFTLDDSEKVNYSRPNIDVSMESVLNVFGSNTIGVLLTGTNNDGSIGLKNISEAGGYTIVQSPETCQFSEMPNNAIRLKKPNAILSPLEIANYITHLKN